MKNRELDPQQPVPRPDYPRTDTAWKCIKYIYIYKFEYAYCVQDFILYDNLYVITDIYYYDFL